MRSPWLIGLLCAAAVEARADERVRGRVVDGRGRPIEAATVYSTAAEVAVTDADGRFSIAVPPGTRTLTVTAPGFAARTVALAGAARIALEVDGGGEVIEVVGERADTSAATSYQLSRDQIRRLPGAGNDVLRAVQSLPGVARIPFGFGGLVLRGQSPRDTSVYLDGVEVPIAFHFGGVVSFYPSSMLEALTVMNGGFDVAFGRAQGGVVALRSREPRRDRWRVGGELGLLHSAASVEGPAPGGGAMMIGFRRSYIDLIAGPFVSDDVPLPSYWDAQLRTSWGDPASRGRIAPTVFLSLDRVANDEVEFNSAFVRATAPYTRRSGLLTLQVTPWLGGNLLSFEENEGEGEASLRRPTYPAGLRAELARDAGWGHLRGGLDVQGVHVSSLELGFEEDGDDGPGELGLDTSATWLDAAAWAEARYAVLDGRLAVKPGLRVERYGLTDEIVVDPRLNVSQRLTDAVTLRQAIGRFHQPPIAAEIDPTVGNPDLGASYTDQVSLGLDAALPASVITSVTGFYHYGRELGVPAANPRTGEPPDIETDALGAVFRELLEKQIGFSSYRENVGRARSYGVELSARRDVGRLFAFLSYTLAVAERRDDPRRTLDWRPYELDQRHNLHLAAAVRFEHWQFGGRVTATSGAPVEIGRCSICPGSRLPTFFALDLRADRRWIRPWGEIELSLEIQNATDRRNVEDQDLDAQGRVVDDLPGLPLIPFIGVEWLPR